MESKSERFNFKYYIKNVKEGKIPWEFFASLMKDLSQTLVSAQKLNDLLLDELKFSIENLSLKSESIKNESNVEEPEDFEMEHGDKYNQEPEIGNSNGFLLEQYEHYSNDLDSKIANDTDIEVTNGFESETEQEIYQGVENHDLEGIDQGAIEEPGEVVMDAENRDIHDSEVLPESSNQYFPQHIDENKIIDKVFGCGQCEEAFESTQQLDDHISIQHNSKDKLLCHNCDKTFSRSDKLKNHIKNIHDRIKDKSCDLCDYKTGDNWKLKRHIASLHESKESGNIHTEETENVQCSLCEKVFIKSRLSRHIAIVHKKLKFQCQLCDKNFLGEDKLKVHVKCVHEKVKDKLCDKCDLRFVDNYRLKRHVSQVHAVIKTDQKYQNVQCNLCGKVMTNSSLKRHIEVVHEHVRHQCDRCEKSFQKKFLLDNHIKSFHEGINPFKCEECGKSFSKQHVLTRHFVSVHENRYQCDSCSRKFSCFSVLDKHKLENH